MRMNHLRLLQIHVWSGTMWLKTKGMTAVMSAKFTAATLVSTNSFSSLHLFPAILLLHMALPFTQMKHLHQGIDAANNHLHLAQNLEALRLKTSLRLCAFQCIGVQLPDSNSPHLSEEENTFTRPSIQYIMLTVCVRVLHMFIKQAASKQRGTQQQEMQTCAPWRVASSSHLQVSS